MYSHSRGSKTIQLQPLEIDDLELVMAWRSDPDIYRHLLQQEEPLEWDEHLNWYAGRPESRRDFLIKYDGRRVGVVSINTDDMISIYVGAKDLWGAGIGTMAVEWLCEHCTRRTPRTKVDVRNERANSLFESLDFSIVNESDGVYEYKFEGTDE